MKTNTLENIDLTMRSWFASDEDPALRITDAYRYYQKREEANNPIEDFETKIEAFFNNFQFSIIPDIFSEDRYDYEKDDCFFSVFDEHQTLSYDNIPYGETCDMCGVNIKYNILISSPYSLCDDCNQYMEESKYKRDEELLQD